MRIVLLFLLSAAALVGDTAVWTRFQAELRASRTYADPLRDVRVDAEFRSPSGTSYRVQGFWDGDNVWRIRFSPNETGQWSWSTRASTGDEGLIVRGASFRCTAYGGPNPLYRHGALRVSASGHHFEHADGTPTLWIGDTVWNGVLLSDARDWRTFLQDRAAKGFNVIQYVTTQWSAAYGDASGRVAYTGRERIEIDPAFFQRMDERVAAINEHGLFAAPVLLWTAGRRDINPGHLPEDQAVLLARYMTARYGAYQVIWFLNGDGNYTGENAERWKRIGRAVFAEGHPNRLSTLHPQRMRWMSDDFSGEPYFHFNGYQSGHRDDDEHLRWLTAGPPATNWKRDRPIPLVNLEPNYEAHRSRVAGATHVFTAHDVRRAAYWSLMVAPPAGITYGGHGIWSWETMRAEPLNHRGTGLAPPWNEAMRLPGSSDIQRAKSLFSAVSWWKLRPAQDALAEQPGSADRRRFVTVLRNEPDGVVLAYLPTGEIIRFQARVLEGMRHAQWFNPRTGAWTEARAADGRFHAPDSQDWVLLLTRQASDVRNRRSAPR